jgi:predicted MFS family arabinose efflux permease
MAPRLPKSLQIILPFTLGYFLSYAFRVVNAVLAPQLVAELSVSAADLGLLTSIYFITFAAFQLPLGMLLDRFGPRRVEGLLLIVAAVGAALFARAESLAGLVVGRGLIGLGVSACLMAAFKAYVIWFPRQQLPLINGVQVAAGGLGALFATAPVQALLGYTDWRGIFAGLAGVTLLAAAVIFWLVPRDPVAREPLRWSEQLQGLVTIFTSLDFWRIAPWSTLNQASFLAIHGLWLGPYLRDMLGLDSSAAARILFMAACGMIAGYIGLGLLAERLSRRGIAPMRVGGAGMAIFIGLLGWLVLQLPHRHPLFWVLFGFFGTSGIITYAVLSQHFAAALSGRVNTALNLLVFVAAFGAQWGIGAVIDQWPITADGGYAAAGYRSAFGLLLLLQMAAASWCWVAGRLNRRSAPDAADTLAAPDEKGLHRR